MSEPSTTAVRRKVTPGRDKDNEVWLERKTREVAEHLKGYLGAEFNRPGVQDGKYRSVLRFDCPEFLDDFERSDIQRRMLTKAEPIFAADTAGKRMKDFEFWFDPPSGKRVPEPTSHRRALVLIVVVFCPVRTLNVALDSFMVCWPLPVRVLINFTIQVTLMTYVIVPRLTPLIARLIYPNSITL